MNQTVHDLKILASIPQNGRISSSISSSTSSIKLEDEKSTITWIRRFMSPDSRKKAIRDINAIVERAANFMDTLVNSKYINVYENNKEPSESELDRHLEDMHHLITLYNELKHSITGIANLKETTYRNDTSINAEMEIILTDVTNKVAIIENKIKRINSFKDNDSSYIG